MTTQAGFQGIKPCYGLVIGIGQYRDERIRGLHFTSADARAVHALLIDPKHAAFPPDNVKLLIDEQATRFNIENAISGWLYQQATPESTVVIFYAGHGGVEGDRTQQEKDGLAKYLLPWDANLDNLFASAVSNRHFSQLLKTLRAKRQVVFMDACYSGGVIDQGARDVSVVDPYQYLAGEGRLMIAASKPNQRSYEHQNLGHGIFTHHLLEALRGKADYDDNGQVTAIEVFRYLQDNVPITARKLAQNDQEPILQGDMISKDITLTVDAELLARRKADQVKQVEARREQLATQRTQWMAFLNRGEVPLDVFQQGMMLIESDPAQLNAEEQELREYLLPVLEGRVSVNLYLKARQRIHPAQPKPHIEPEPVEPPRLQFCTQCGAKLIPGLAFCTQCGKQISA